MAGPSRQQRAGKRGPAAVPRAGGGGRCVPSLASSFPGPAAPPTLPWSHLLPEPVLRSCWLHPAWLWSLVCPFPGAPSLGLLPGLGTLLPALLVIPSWGPPHGPCTLPCACGEEPRALVLCRPERFSAQWGLGARSMVALGLGSEKPLGCPGQGRCARGSWKHPGCTRASLGATVRSPGDPGGQR